MYSDNDIGLQAAASDEEVRALLTRLAELRKRSAVLLQGAAAEVLCGEARVQSVEASNRIEGIATSLSRLQRLMRYEADPMNGEEAEIAGYRDVLDAVNKNYTTLEPTPCDILQMHRDLYAYSGVGGMWKRSDNIIAGMDANGCLSVRFRPVSARNTPGAMVRLCSSFLRSMAAGRGEPLLLIILFVLDFLCIHPFHDGNGRMSRLLTTLLLYRNGVDAGRYISLDKLIFSSRRNYYKTLQTASCGWHEDHADCVPFVRYFLGILAEAYTELENRMRAAG